MGLYRGIGALSDLSTAVSDRDISARVSRVRHTPSYIDRPNSGKACRIECCSMAEICAYSKALSMVLSSSLLCCQFCHSSPLARAIASCSVVPISNTGHVLVHLLLSVLWYYSESVYYTVSDRATTVVGPMQTHQNVLFVLDDQPKWQKRLLCGETGDESSLVRD